jgi:hypothetical protein
MLAVNKSPLKYVVKSGVAIAHLPRVLTRRRSARALLAPDLIIQEHVRNLRKNGFTMLRQDDVSPELLRVLSEEAHAKLSKPAREDPAKKMKKFWTRLLDEDVKEGKLTPDNVFVRFALQRRVLEVVSGYFGAVPYLAYVFLSLSESSDEDLSTSQLWHQDKDDVRVLKMFTYLTEVPDIDHGPFSFLPASASRRIKNGFFPRPLTDDQVFQNVDRQAVQVMTAPRLTTFMVDTSRCYHMGSRMAPGKSRLMYTATFITAPSIYPDQSNGIRNTASASDLERLVLVHH